MPVDFRRTDSSRAWPYAAALALFAIALHSNLLFRKDLTAWERHWLAQGPTSLSAAFTSPAVTERGARVYRPLAALALSPLRPPGAPNQPFRQVLNVVLHAGVVALVFLLGRVVISSTVLGAGGALLFAVHPAHVEVVARIDGCAELLAATGVLLSLWLLARGRGAETGRGAAAAVAAGAAAVLSNEAALSLPFLWLALARPWTASADSAGRDEGSAVGAGFWGVLAVCFAALAAKHLVAGSFGSAPGDFVENPLAVAPMGERLSAGAAILGRYFVSLTWPFRLSPDYSFDAVPLPGSEGFGALLGAAALVAALGVLAFAARERRPVYLSCWLFFIVALLPSLNLFFPAEAAVSDRFLYLPSVGFFWGMMQLFNDVGWMSRYEAALRRPTAQTLKPLTLILISLILPWGTATFVRNREWRTERGLLQTAVRRMPQNARLHVALGRAQVQHGDSLAAERHFSRALDIRPSYRPALLGLEAAWRQLGRDSEADQLKQLIEKGAGASRRP